MPAETVINQPEALVAVQEAFDKAVPSKPKVAAIPEAVPQQNASTAPIEPPKAIPEAPVEKPVATSEPKAPEYKLPSFVLGEEPHKPAEPAPVEEELPVEAPVGSDEKTKVNWAKARAKIDRQEAELKELRAKAQSREDKGKEPNQAEAKRILDLERENNELKSQFQRVSIENHPEFINQVLRPLQASYSEAKRIINDAGGDSSALDRALVATGKAHYDAMDEILSGLPESAKAELTASIRDWRRFNTQRQNALANAPKVAEDFKRADEARQLQAITQYQKETEDIYDAVVKHARDDYGFELLRKSDDPSMVEWNTMVDNIVTNGKELVRTQDRAKMAQAALFGTAAITLRDLWKRELKTRLGLERELAALRSSEPSLGTSSGPSTPHETNAETLKIPFEKVFLETLHKQTGRG